MTNIRLLLIVCFVLAQSGTAGANAFALNEHDAKATGRANATTATSTDPSSIAYNPGGVAVAPGTQFAVGGAIVLAHGGYTDTLGNETSTDNDPAVIAQLFVTTRVSDLVSVGIGVYTPFGLAINWPDDSAQAGAVQAASLRTLFISPAVGVNLDRYVPGLSIGGGVDIVPASVELTQLPMFGDPADGGVRGRAELAGTAVGFGGRVGVMYRPADAPRLSLGAMWRSSVHEEFSGTGDFDAAAPFRAQLPADGDIATSITLPMSAQLGVAYRPLNELELEINAVWMRWSSFDELAIDVSERGGETSTIRIPQDYEDTVSLRVGAEYSLFDRAGAVRAGYMYDPTPIKASALTALLPDADRHIVSAGGSYQFAGTLAAHLGLLWVLPRERDTADELYMPIAKGRYELQALVASVTLSGSFGQ